MVLIKPKVHGIPQMDKSLTNVKNVNIKKKQKKH